MEATPGQRDQKSAAPAIVMGVVLAALVIIVALVLSARDDGARDRAAGAGSSVLDVDLGDLFIKPEQLKAPGRTITLRVKNKGAIPHTLGLEGTKKVTPTLDAGESATLRLGQLEPGSYRLFCTVPGHADAGMVGKLNVGSLVQSAKGSGSTWEAMDAAMAKRIKAFPAKTEGLGAQLLEPKVLPDGTKQFDLTTQKVRWEIEPGKRVGAVGYNGVVPGPTIKVNDGDRVRVVLQNNLDESTSIHFHGVLTPNDQDGVPFITQEPVKPGERFTYEFTARGPAVGAYHSHHNAHRQVPDGLFAPFIVGTLPLPPGVRVNQELPMVLNDAGSLGYSLNGKSFPATTPIVAQRDEWVLVHYLNEGLQSHPMHLHGLVQRIIAKDGFPLAVTQDVDTVNVAPGERYSVLIRADASGIWAWHCHILSHAERDDGMFGMVTAMIVK